MQALFICLFKLNNGLTDLAKHWYIVITCNCARYRL